MSLDPLPSVVVWCVLVLRPDADAVVWCVLVPRPDADAVGTNIPAALVESRRR